MILQRDDRLPLACYDIILSPSEDALCCECYQRRNIVEGETRNSAICLIKKFVTNTEEIRKNFEVLVQISKYHAK